MSAGVARAFLGFSSLQCRRLKISRTTAALTDDVPGLCDGALSYSRRAMLQDAVEWRTPSLGVSVNRASMLVIIFSGGQNQVYPLHFFKGSVIR